MTDQIKEQISALLDGELPPDQLGLLVRRMERDDGLRRAFGNYVLVGEALRAPGGTLASPGFACRVMAAIEERPDQERSLAGVTGTSTGSRWARPVIGAGLAASVLLAAVVLMSTRTQAPEVVAAVTAPAASFTVASNDETPANSVSPTPEESQRMTGYLVAHSEFATPMGRRNLWSGVLADDPDISRVSYEMGETP